MRFCSLLLHAAKLLPLLLTTASAQVISFSATDDSRLLAASGNPARIYVDSADYYGVQRAANDLAVDFGRVVGVNGTVLLSNATRAINSTALPIIVGSLNNSAVIDSLVTAGRLNVSAIQGQWESYLIQTVSAVPNIGDALVIAGADKRGAIFGIYDISQQIGVSPWYWWADIGVIPQSSVYSTGSTKVQGSPSVKYRGIFINDEQPALTNWIQTQWPDLPSGSAAFNHQFYSLVFELLLRLRANYLWPAMWGSEFYLDDKLNGQTANDFGIVMGTSHTEPLARATNEQQPPTLQGPWAWINNKANVTEFLREGVERSKNYETLWTMGMRGHGDNASPSLNSTLLEDVVKTQQQILRDVLNTTDLSDIPQMWCLYKEVGNYYAAGMDVPDDITLLWAEDNWGNAQRLPLVNETSRSGGSGIYYHVDYVGDPRDYKWINTINLQKSWQELTQAYERGAQRIWILNVGDLKPLEVPIHHFLDMAYEMESFKEPSSTQTWLHSWAGSSFGPENADTIADIVLEYGFLAGRRKYELIDPTVYSIVNYNEADDVLSRWASLVSSAQKVYSNLDSAVQPGFFELILHPSMAGHAVHEIHVGAAKNNLYTLQGRNSANSQAAKVLDWFNQDADITQRYHDLLGGKWTHMMDQTHLGYNYWQQPMRNTIPPLGYVQQREQSLAGAFGITAEANNGSVSGDDNYHSLSSNVLTLPPMDPYGPASRWIEVYNRGVVPVSWSINASHPAVSVSEPTGTLNNAGNFSSTDRRLQVSVDWTKVDVPYAQVTLSVMASADIGFTGFINASRHQYGSYNAPSIVLPINKTSVADDFTGFVETDRTISIEPEHYTSISNGSTSASLEVIPGFGRTLSGIHLIPNTAPSQNATGSSPHLSYDMYTFTNTTKANITVYLGAGLNTDPTRPLRYALALDGGNATIVQPIPSTVFGTLPSIWGAMVGNAAASNTTTVDMSMPGKHRLDVWLLEPGVVLQKIVVDLGGVRKSYLGPPETARVVNGTRM